MRGPHAAEGSCPSGPEIGPRAVSHRNAARRRCWPMLGTLEWAVGQRSVDSGLWPHAQKADPAKGSGKANSDTHQNFSWLKYSLFGMIGDLKASSSTTA